MVYVPVGIKNKGTPKKIYLYRDTFGVVCEFTSAQIKSMWGDNIFHGVKLDSVGRLIEDVQMFNMKASTPSLVQASPDVSTIRGYKVITGAVLQATVADVTKNKHERCAVEQILSVLANYCPGKVCTIRGLRRTGKTTAVFQVINNLLSQGVSADKIGYIAITVNIAKPDSTLTDEVIDRIERCAWEYVFVDEITHLTGILHWLKTLSDFISLTKKIVLTGTDSYVWPMAARDVLYGRQMTVDLTYMSFKEYCNVFPKRVEGLSKFEMVRQFALYGGVLDENEYIGLKNAYTSLQTAIVENIINTIFRNKEHSTIKNYTGELYAATKEQLTEAVICAIISACRTQNEAAFKTSGVKVPDLAASILEKQGAFKAAGVSQKVLTRLTAALMELNILDRIENFAKQTDLVIPEGKAELTCHISSLYSTIVRSIGQSEELTGDVLENLILSQCVQFARTEQQKYIAAFSLKSIEVGYCRYNVAKEFYDGVTETNPKPEADIVIRCWDYGTITKCCVVEVKKTAKGSESAQTENLLLPSMLEAIGRIDRRVVVYMGEPKTVNGVEYVNAYDFLMDIGKWVAM